MEREYLKNNICNFKPLFKINYTKKTNILSTCFFKMVGSGYKNFSMYVDGLIDLDKFITKTKSNYKIRLFIDNSIYNDKNIYEKISSLTNVQPVLYSCPNYIIHNKDQHEHHIGLFGTMVRFFPFFNFENNDANIVVSADIDGTNKQIFQKYIKMFKTDNIISNFFNNIYLFKSGPLYRSLKYNFDVFYKDKFNPYVYALSFVSIKRINSEVLINFLKDVDNDKNNTIYSYHYISEVNPNSNKNTKEIDSKYKSHGKFIYGIDEYFLNTTLSNYLIDNKLCYLTNISWSVYGCLYYILKDIQYLTEKNIHLIDLILKYIYDKLKFTFNKNESVIEKFNRLDNIIYLEKNTKITYKINLLIYKLFLYFRNNNNYNFLFPKYYYKLFVDDNKYFGIYSIELIKIINCKKNDEDIVIEQEKFNQLDIENLKKFYLQHKK